MDLAKGGLPSRLLTRSLFRPLFNGGVFSVFCFRAHAVLTFPHDALDARFRFSRNIVFFPRSVTSPFVPCRYHAAESRFLPGISVSMTAGAGPAVFLVCDPVFRSTPDLQRVRAF